MNEQSIQADNRTLIQRLLAKAFPLKAKNRWAFMERGTGHGLTATTTVFLSWPDRLRVLAGGIIQVDTTINTENDPGASESMAVTSILRPGWKP